MLIIWNKLLKSIIINQPINTYKTRERNCNFSKKNNLIKVPVNVKNKTQIKIKKPDESYKVIRHTGA